ncbi:MAG: hypothetical protein NTY19_28175 [Planctomycetota bacterium]|nr:hypothetical protein [Planctomycetota bacterium]
MVRSFALSLTFFGVFVAMGIGSATTFGQGAQQGSVGSGAPGLGPGVSDIRSVLTNPLYSRYRPHHQPQTGISPAYQQQALLQQQMILEQQRAMEKAQKREAARERKLETARERRTKELQLREQKRQEQEKAAQAATSSTKI